jgi:hypothetical protein
MAFRVVMIFRITATMATFDFFPACEAFVEGFERRIEAASSQAVRRHVEHSPDRCAPAQMLSAWVG